jgi:hypothetical protein
MDWTEIPLRDNGHVDTEPGSTPALTVVEAIESGFGALVVWCAGPDHALRAPAADASQRQVTLQLTGPDGRQQRTLRPFTDADQTAIDDDINCYLTAAGVQPRPPGFRWFIRLPRHTSGPEVRQAIETVLPRVLAAHSTDQ